jgi:hypothetical protein
MTKHNAPVGKTGAQTKSLPHKSNDIHAVKAGRGTADQNVVDRRLEARYSSDFEVRVTTMEGGAQTVTGVLVNLSESGICAMLRSPLPDGALVQLDLADTVLYGQVTYCIGAFGQFRTGVAVERVLLQAADLSSILHALLADSESEKLTPRSPPP